jgi:hypothetical protein
MFWRGLGLDHPLAAHKVESWGAYHRSRSPDAREGVASFFEKRPPDFPMRVPSDLPDFFPWWDDKRFWNSPTLIQRLVRKGTLIIGRGVRQTAAMRLPKGTDSGL